MSLDVEGLYEQYHRPVRAYFARRLEGADDDTLDDMVADVFERVIRAAPRFQDRGTAPEAWLWRIARNLLIDYYRREHGKVTFVRLGARNPFGEDAGSDGHVESLHAQITIGKALETYRTGNSHWPPDRHIAVIRERYFEGGTDAEIGARLGMTAMVVKAVRKRALVNLRKLMGAA